MTIETVSGSVLNGFDREAARRRADRIRTAAEELWDTIAVAYQQRDWLALDYRSWDEYCQTEFGSLRIRIPREERAEVVSSLRDSGLSLRAIQAATGLSPDTSRRALAEGVRNRTPAPERIDFITGEVLTDQRGGNEPPSPSTDVEEQESGVGSPPASRPAPITGLDGKTYPRPTPSAPRRSPLPESFWRATYDLTRKVEAIVRLSEDDRFTQNVEKVATANRSDLLRARDALQRVIDQLPERKLS